MLVELNTSVPTAIDWGASGANEVAQNVLTLINTMKYEVAYDRTLGVPQQYLDMPLQEAVILATSEIYAIIDEREPRAKVSEVTFLGTEKDGTLQFKVVIEI